MADPATASPTETASGTAASGTVAQGTGATMDQILAAMLGVTNSLQELTNKMNVVTQAVRQTSTTDDTNMEVSTIGNDDAFMGLRNERVAQSGMQVQLLRLTAASVDHFIEQNKMGVAVMSGIAATAGRHADIAVAGHWSTSPGNATPLNPAPSATKA